MGFKWLFYSKPQIKNSPTVGFVICQAPLSHWFSILFHDMPLKVTVFLKELWRFGHIWSQRGSFNHRPPQCCEQRCIHGSYIVTEKWHKCILLYLGIFREKTCFSQDMLWNIMNYHNTSPISFERGAPLSVCEYIMWMFLVSVKSSCILVT